MHASFVFRKFLHSLHISMNSPMIVYFMDFKALYGDSNISIFDQNIQILI